MNSKKIFFNNFFFLIYGFGKSGASSFKYLKNNNRCVIFDDNQNKIPNKYKNSKINFDKLKKTIFDYIVLSPGIDIDNCKIKNYLKKNRTKIITDLDIFYLSFPKIKKITITGTNGKSTTSKLLHDIFREHKKDSRLTGNIGNPILLEKNITKKTIFVIEASSYQLEYSKFFRTNYAVILNLSPDHLERHGNFKSYIYAKFKLLMNQISSDYAFVENRSKYLKYLINKHKPKSKIRYVTLKRKNLTDHIKNIYIKNKNNIENLNYIFELSKYLKLNKNKILKVANNFKGLKYRQQKIYDRKNLIIINDSKSTSFSSTLPLLESHKNIFWILGGMAKKNDKFHLKRKYYQSIRGFIYGKDKFFFSKILKNKIKIKINKNLLQSLEAVFKEIRKDSKEKNIILFSPCAASFDQFKNFEDRGKYFDIIIKKILKKNEKFF